MRVRATRTAALGTGPGRTLAQEFSYALSSLRSAGVPITNQLLADQWAYQQRALALFPGQPAKCVLFQDAAGTTPVTAVEQPIGLALDLETAGTWDGVTALTSLPGTHMRQATTSKRAMFSARVNLLQRTEEFDNAVWTKTNASVSTDIVPSPTGTQTADALIEANTGLHQAVQVVSGSLVADYSFSVCVKWIAGTTRNVVVYPVNVSLAGSLAGVIFNSSGQFVGIAGSGSVVSYSSESLADGWWKFTVVENVTAAGQPLAPTVRLVDGESTSYTGDGVSGVYIWGADLRLSVDVHPSIPAYQRVTTATDYDTDGFPVYKRFDGTDDGYASIKTLNLTGTDEITVFTPITKESDATTGIPIEFGVSSTVSGSFYIGAPGAAASPTLSAGFRGVGNAVALVSGQAAPRKSLLTCIGKISTDTALLRVNGVQAASSASDQRTGNYGNHTLFEGARNQSSLYFRGESQGLLILGKNLTASQLAIVEKYINQLWKAY